MKFSCCTLDKDEIIQIARSDHKNVDFIKLLKLVSHPIRLRILQILTIEEEILTCELTDIFSDPQPAITKQLTKLKSEGILSSRKLSYSLDEDKEGEWKKEEKSDGKYTAYRIDPDKKELVTYLLKPSISDKYQPQINVVAMKVIGDTKDDILSCLSSCGERINNTHKINLTRD